MKCACITILQLLGQTHWQSLNLFNLKTFLSVADGLISANFKPCLDLTLIYNILSGHISATVRIWIAAADYCIILHNYDISIDSYSPVNKFHIFIIFSLLNCLVLIFSLLKHYLDSGSALKVSQSV